LHSGSSHCAPRSGKSSVPRRAIAVRLFSLPCARDLNKRWLPSHLWSGSGRWFIEPVCDRTRTSLFRVGNGHSSSGWD
jgi:hypothetical protein